LKIARRISTSCDVNKIDPNYYLDNTNTERFSQNSQKQLVFCSKSGASGFM
jgi:hypothetical protein